MAFKVAYVGDNLGCIQAEALGGQLANVLGHEIEFLPVVEPVASIEANSVFASPTYVALHNLEANILVRSLQDVPINISDGLSLASVTERIDPREAAITENMLPLVAMPTGTEVIVDNPRRAATVKRLRPDLVPKLQHICAEQIVTDVNAQVTPAGIVALSDLTWLGLESSAAEIMQLGDVIPAPGQGSLGLIIRADDEVAKKAVEKVKHAPSFACVEAERALFSMLDIGMHMPVGANATIENNRMIFRAAIMSYDGTKCASAIQEGAANEGHAIAMKVADELSANGGDELLLAAYQGLPQS